MIEDLKPYPKYKDSGVPWLGEVPEYWTVQKLRSILAMVTERNRPDLPLLSVVREKGVIQRDTSSKDENRNFIPDDLSNYKVVQPGQFAMNKMKAWQGSYGVSQHIGIVSPAYFVFDVRAVRGDFFHAAIRSRAYVPFFTQASDGVRIGQWDLSQARMKEIPFVVPPEPEQIIIVRFLDYMDRRIRRYIRAKQKLLGAVMRQLSHFERETSFLSQYRTRLIVDVVTGKLDVREAATRLPEGADDQELLVEANALSYDSEDANDNLAAASEDEYE
jgi:type I restriction enzyme S subunit